MNGKNRAISQLSAVKGGTSKAYTSRKSDVDVIAKKSTKNDKKLDWSEAMQKGSYSVTQVAGVAILLLIIFIIAIKQGWVKL